MVPSLCSQARGHGRSGRTLAAVNGLVGKGCWGEGEGLKTVSMFGGFLNPGEIKVGVVHGLFLFFLTVVTVNDTQVGRQRFSNVYQALKNRTISAFYPKNGFFSVKTFSVSGSIGLVFLTRLF